MAKRKLAEISGAPEISTEKASPKEKIIKVVSQRNIQWETDRSRRKSVLQQKIDNTQRHVDTHPTDALRVALLKKLHDRMREHF